MSDLTPQRLFKPLAGRWTWAVLAAALCGTLAGCGSSRVPRNLEPPPEVLLRGVRLTYFKKSERAATGRAAQLIYQRSTGEFQADEAFMRFTSQQAKPEGHPMAGGLEVRSARVTGNLNRQQVLGEGDVRMRTGAGMRGQTERAAYDGIAGTIQGSVPVTFETQTYTEKAEGGFLFELPAENYLFLGPTVTEIAGSRTLAARAASAGPAGGTSPARPDEGVSRAPDSIRIHAPMTNFNKGVATWTERVLVTRGETRLWCDKLHAHLTPQKGAGSDGPQALERVECVGNVDATQGDMRTRSERADFDNVTGVLVMTGKPWAQSGPNQMHGDEVRFDSERNVLTVTPARTTFQSVPASAGSGSSLSKATEPGVPIEIDSEKFTLLNDRRKATWSGKVKVRRGKLRMSCGKLTADYTPEQELDGLLCSQGVVATEGEMRASGATATFDPARDLITLKGNAVLTQGENRTLSPRIMFYPGQQRAVAEKGYSEFVVPKRPSDAEGSGTKAPRSPTEEEP